MQWYGWWFDEHDVDDVDDDDDDIFNASGTVNGLNVCPLRSKYSTILAICAERVFGIVVYGLSSNSNESELYFGMRKI